MNPLKQKYLDRIRSESAYVAFRGYGHIAALVFNVVGILVIIVGAFIGFGLLGGGMNLGALIGGLILGLFYIVLGKLILEGAPMLADVADSITDLNSRYEGQ